MFVYWITKLDPPRNTQQTRCNDADNSFNNDPKATSTGICPKSLYGPNQNCGNCMLQYCITR
jgi:hypothetical protein